MNLGPPPRLLCGRGAPGPVAADPGRPVWQGIEGVWLRENVGGEPPAQATRVRVCRDGDLWRILFEADARAPWATLTIRDGALWLEEVVEVFIDPVGDGLGYFEIEINPLGTVTDLVLRRTVSGWRKEFAWDVEGLASCARRTGTGWAAELAIPFDALGPDTASAEATQWRVNFLRIDRPDGPGTSRRELSAWSPTGLPNFHQYDRFGTVEFT